MSSSLWIQKGMGNVELMSKVKVPDVTHWGAMA